MHYDVPLTSSRVRVATLPFVVVHVAVSVIGGGGGGGSGAVVDRGSVGRTEFMRRDPARRLITEKNFIKGKFDSRTRDTERIVGSRGVEPFAVVHRVRKSRCSV